MAEQLSVTLPADLVAKLQRLSMATGQSVDEVLHYELRRSLSGMGSGPLERAGSGRGMLQRSESARLYTSAPVRGPLWATRDAVSGGGRLLAVAAEGDRWQGRGKGGMGWHGLCLRRHIRGAAGSAGPPDYTPFVGTGASLCGVVLQVIAIVEGVLTGDTTVGSALKKGDFGIGTLNLASGGQRSNRVVAVCVVSSGGLAAQPAALANWTQSVRHPKHLHPQPHPMLAAGRRTGHFGWRGVSAGCRRRLLPSGPSCKGGGLSLGGVVEYGGVTGNSDWVGGERRVCVCAHARALATPTLVPPWHHPPWHAVTLPDGHQVDARDLPHCVPQLPPGLAGGAIP